MVIARLVTDLTLHRLCPCKLQLNGSTVACQVPFAQFCSGLVLVRTVIMGEREGQIEPDWMQLRRRRRKSAMPFLLHGEESQGTGPLRESWWKPGRDVHAASQTPDDA